MWCSQQEAPQYRPPAKQRHYFGGVVYEAAPPCSQALLQNCTVFIWSSNEAHAWRKLKAEKSNWQSSGDVLYV